MSRSQARWWLVAIGVLLWVLVVYAAYYVVHKPLSTASLYALANVVADLLIWLAMLAVATALGSRLTRHLAYHSLLERLTISAGRYLTDENLVHAEQDYLMLYRLPTGGEPTAAAVPLGAAQRRPGRSGVVWTCAGSNLAPADYDDGLGRLIRLCYSPGGGP